ncbi:aminodeoxychorismate synthase component I [Halocynthiibacter namhaensis]|uniref:aminodeoxychorismate synthase component I n=1 Tax=Halocynthiibacter namhaensis TaxID=1290553 RepID=UPI0009DD76F3|nr:aminodeoxychorismate synthase component I [Halocynthiibacter namhaensis]
MTGPELKGDCVQGEIFFDDGLLGQDAGGTWFRAPKRVISADTAEDVPAALLALNDAEKSGEWLAGFASYELGYALIDKLRGRMPTTRDTPLLCFGVFDEPLPGGAEMSGAAELSGPAPRWDLARYRRAFDEVKHYIGSGDCYQINLTFPMDSQMSGDAKALYAQLVDRQKVQHGAYVDLGGAQFLSRSPELFFRTDGRMIETLPMKGTVARGLSSEEDAARIKWLQNDEKNRAENLMIVDLLRNDISRVSMPGTVTVPELFDVQTFATVHQMVSRVRAQLAPDQGLAEIFRALFPCGSITGAPKIRAMEIIDDLEDSPRGIYCGAIGWSGPGGQRSFNVAIRTLSLFDEGRVRLNVGGGVVWDSTAPSEYEEALWKARYAEI